MNNNPDLSQGSVGRLLFKLAVPCISAQIINVLYNMVDRMYIGHIANAGPDALTGVGVTFPLIMAVSAFAGLICMGSAPRAAIFMGKDDNKTAQDILNQCLSLTILCALVLTVLLEWCGRDLLMLFGASERTIPYAWSYMQIYLMGTLFVMISLGMNAFINTQGFAMWGMATVGIGALINIILDPILIFGLNMGVAGAALATILSQAISAVFCLWFLRSKYTFLRLEKRLSAISWSLMAPCLLLGLSPFIMQSTEALISVCFNSSLQRYGGDTAVGAMTILSSVMQFSMLPLQGLSQGAQPILSYNYGAGLIERVKKCFKVLLITCLIYSTLLWALCELFPGMFALLFTDHQELIPYTRTAMRIYMAASLLFGAQIGCQQTFLALGNAKTSLFLAVLRKIILLLPLIYLLPLLDANNAEKALAVFAAEPAADLIAVSATCILFYRFYRQKLSLAKA